MSAWDACSNRVLRLPFILFLTLLWLASPVRGQDEPPGGQPANAAAPASQSMQSPAGLEPNQPDADEEGAPGSPREASPTDLGAPETNITNPSIFPAHPLNGGSIDTLTGQLTSPVGTANPDPFSRGYFGLGYDPSPKIGDVQGSFSFTVSGSQPYVPFIYRAFAPDDANLKAGPLYLKFESLEAALYYTDNYALSAVNRQSETLAIISLNMTLIAQLTDDLQVAINGTLIYLPIQNIIGLETSSLNGNFLLFPLPALLSQVSYDTLIAGWEVLFIDQFGTGSGSYADGTTAAFNLYNGSYLQQEGKDRFSFHSGHIDLRSESSTTFDNEDNDFFYYFYNILSAYTSRYLPGDVVLSANASRMDLWYNQGNRGLPTSRDDLVVEAQSVRENMRFKPFISYQISHSSDVPGVYQSVYAGFSGPITDQLFLYAAVGYYLSNTGNAGLLWDVSLRHDAGPYTTEWLQVARQLSYFNDEVVTTEYYRLAQVLGPTLTGYLFADHSTFDYLGEEPISNNSDEDVGVELSWILGPQTTVSLFGIYTHQQFSDGTLTNTWTGRIDLERRITDTLFFRAIYQYQRYSVNRSGAGYFDNLVYLSLVKYFQ